MFKNIRRTIVASVAALALGIGGAVWATTAASAAPAAAPACATANLAVWVDVGQGSAAAGTTFYPLDFTNTGSRACTLFGYPGVSATNASLIKVYAPNQRTADYGFFSLPACTVKGSHVYLRVAAIQPGTNI